MKAKLFKRDNILTINPFYFLKVLFYKSPYIIIVTLIGLIGSVYFTNKYSSSSYKAVAKIIRYDKKISMPTDVPYKFQNFNYETALQTIRIRKNLSEVISKLGLKITVEKLYSSYEIKRDKNSDIIEIIYLDNSKEEAVEGANLLAEIFLKNFNEVQNAATKEVLNYYDIQKDSFRKDIDILLEQKDQFNKTNKILSLSVELDYKYKQLNEIALNIINTKVLENEYITKVKEIQQKIDSIPQEVQLNYTVRSADLKNIENKEKELVELKQKYTEDNPKVKTLINEIKNMKESLITNTSKKNIPDEITYGDNPLYTALIIELSQSNIGIISTKNRLIELLDQSKSMEEEIRVLNELDKKYSLLSKKIDETNSLLEIVTRRHNELKIAIESTQEDFKFLEKAKAPRYPESNYKKAIIAVTGLFCMSIMICIFILKSFFNPKIKESFDIEQRFNIELIGKFTDSENKREVEEEKMNFITRYMKILKKKKVVLVSSDVEKTGKSFIIDLLIVYLSNIKQKVLYIKIVDKRNTDINESIINPSNIKELDLSKINIINEYIHKLYILNDEDSNNYFANIEISKRLFELLRDSNYTQILFELPSFKDNTFFLRNFGSFADLILYVFKSNHSRKKDVDLIVEELLEFKLKRVKGVLNAIDEKYI